MGWRGTEQGRRDHVLVRGQLCQCEERDSPLPTKSWLAFLRYIAVACVTSSENLCASPCCITRRGLVLKCVVSEALVEIFVVADALDALGMTLDVPCWN